MTTGEKPKTPLLERVLLSVLPTELEKPWRSRENVVGWNGWVPLYQAAVEAAAVASSPSNAFAHFPTEPNTIANGR